MISDTAVKWLRTLLILVIPVIPLLLDHLAPRLRLLVLPVPGLSLVLILVPLAAMGLLSNVLKSRGNFVFVFVELSSNN